MVTLQAPMVRRLQRHHISIQALRHQSNILHKFPIHLRSMEAQRHHTLIILLYNLTTLLLPIRMVKLISLPTGILHPMALPSIMVLVRNSMDLPQLNTNRRLGNTHPEATVTVHRLLHNGTTQLQVLLLLLSMLRLRNSRINSVNISTAKESFRHLPANNRSSNKPHKTSTGRVPTSHSTYLNLRLLILILMSKVRHRKILQLMLTDHIALQRVTMSRSLRVGLVLLMEDMDLFLVLRESPKRPRYRSSQAQLLQL